MLISLIVAAAALAVLMTLAACVQTLYLESMRLLARETASLTYFKEHVQDRLGRSAEQGALVFSFLKHTAMILLTVASFAIAMRSGNVGEAALAAALTGMFTLVMLGYLFPQIVYRRGSGRWLTPMVPLLRLLIVLVKPVTGLLNFLHSLFDLAKPAEAVDEPASPSEHIEALISAGEEEGILEETDKRLIQSVVEFGDKTVREVMTPRPRIVAIDQESSLEDLRQLLIHEQYSRIPVYQGSIDNITGFVHVRDMFELDEQDRATKKLLDVKRPIRLVPETKAVHDLMREMQQSGAHMAVVIDEYGNTAGLVTMEDMVEVIVGEIHDEHEPDRDVHAEPDGSFVVAGSFDVDRLTELLDFRPPEGTESTTIGGLVAEWMGHVPAAGESTERDGLRFKVLAGSDLRVDLVQISKVEAHA
ncbi:MAG: hemolysin family protein [Bryobacteraceae bacterium]|nr:hemolysin family protein [Bryobacteraceae bacterium]